MQYFILDYGQSKTRGSIRVSPRVKMHRNKNNFKDTTVIVNAPKEYRIDT